MRGVTEVLAIVGDVFINGCCVHGDVNEAAACVWFVCAHNHDLPNAPRASPTVLAMVDPCAMCGAWLLAIACC
jgi:hypothetical protein